MATSASLLGCLPAPCQRSGDCDKLARREEGPEGLLHCCTHSGWRDLRTQASAAQAELPVLRALLRLRAGCFGSALRRS